jgi:hypothetical protein
MNLAFYALLVNTRVYAQAYAQVYTRVNQNSMQVVE